MFRHPSDNFSTSEMENRINQEAKKNRFAYYDSMLGEMYYIKEASPSDKQQMRRK